MPLGASLGVLLLPLLSCDRATPTAIAPQQPISVLLVSIDTLRPDALGWVVSGKVDDRASGMPPAGNLADHNLTGHATPHIDRLAAESFRLPAVVSPAPLTLPAHASMFTGLDPPRHGVRDNGQVLGSEVVTLAASLRSAGYRTAAFVSGYPLQRRFGLDSGFDHYDDTLPEELGAAGERSASATTAAALAWLGAQTPDTRAPWFLWVHYFDPHAPYEPRGQAPPTDTRQAYLAEVAAVDAAIGELLAGIARLSANESRLTVLTADHGESLGEHGEPTHGFFAYDSTLLVPALWHLPGRIAAGESGAPARLVDLAPTVLDLVGAPPLAAIDGISLRPLLEGSTLDVPPAYVEALQPWLGYGWAPLKGMRTATAKLIVAPRPELYDLAEDPQELTNRFADNEADADQLQALLRERQALPVAAGQGEHTDTEVTAALRILGYVAPVASMHSAPPEGLVDPKDRLRQKTLLELADEAIRSGAVMDGLATFEVVLAGEPDNRYGLLRLGQVLMEQGLLREAEAPLERLLRLDPEQPEARFALADGLSRSGQTARAIEQWRELLLRQPRRAAAWSNVGTLLVGRGELEVGSQALQRAFDLAPENATFRANLATCQLQLAAVAAEKGEETRTRELLARALELDPSLAEAAYRNAQLAPFVAQSL